MKKLMLAWIVLLMIATLAACGCSHSPLETPTQPPTEPPCVHTYEEDGDCTTPVICTACETVMVAAKAHDFTGEWQKAVDGHYHLCENEGCTAQDAVVAHSNTASACNICGFEFAATLNPNTKPMATMPDIFTQTESENSAFLNDYLYTYASQDGYAQIPASFKFVITNRSGKEILLKRVKIRIANTDGTSASVASREVSVVKNGEETALVFNGAYDEIGTAINATLTAQEQYTAYILALPLADNSAFVGKTLQIVLETADGEFVSYSMDTKFLASANKSDGEDIYNWVSGKSYTFRVSTTCDADCLFNNSDVCEVCGSLCEHEAGDDDGDCTTAVTCKHCTTVVTEARTEHEASEDDDDCTTDIICKHCEQVAVAGNANHTPNADDGSCLTAITCSVCGTTTTEARSEHDFTGEWQKSADGHYHICQNSGCLVEDTKVGHDGGAATCLVGKLCGECGYYYDTNTNPENHASDIYTYEANNNATHKKIHECGVVIAEAEEHKFDENTGECVCGSKLVQINGATVKDWEQAQIDGGVANFTEQGEAQDAVTGADGSAGTSTENLTNGSLSLFVNNGDENSAFVADCEKWTYTDGKWQFDATGSDTEQLLWKDGSEVSWVAASPYRNDKWSHVANDVIGGMNEKVPADQTDAAKWSEFDILWDNGTTTDGSLDINFKHLYTKLQLNMTYGTEVGDGVTVVGVTFGGTYWVRSFHYATHTWSDLIDEVENIKALGLATATDSYDATYEALIIPQTAALTITVTLSDGRMFTTTLDTCDFQSGYQYNINLQVGCNHEYSYSINDDGTHTVICTGACGYSAVEEHDIDFSTGKCKVCDELVALIIDGTFGGKAEATDDEVAALTETIKEYVKSGGSTVIVTGSEMATHNNDYYDNYPAYADALYYVTDADTDTEFDGKVDLILPDVTKLVEGEFDSHYCLKSITLPKVTTIGRAAFYSCSNVETLTFGSVITSVGENAFSFLGDPNGQGGKTDLVLNCGQMEGNYIPDIDKKEWCYYQAQEVNYTWKSITLTHTGECDECKAVE